MSRKSQRRLKSQSLIATGKINPIEWYISKSEAAIALKDFGIPVKEVKKVRCLKHQVCVSYWDINGKVCCSFFSYRIFERWQKAVERLIQNCQVFGEWERLRDIIHYDMLKFTYPVEMADRIWDTLKNRWYQLRTAVRIAEAIAV